MQRELKTERTQLLMRPSTKKELINYSEKNNTSLNDIIQNLIEAFLEANDRGDILCEYDGIVFNPVKNYGMRQSENKTSRVQLLLKPISKKRVKQIADDNYTSINDIIHRLADAFLWELYHI